MLMVHSYVMMMTMMNSQNHYSHLPEGNSVVCWYSKQSGESAGDAAGHAVRRLWRCQREEASNDHRGTFLVDKCCHVG